MKKQDYKNHARIVPIFHIVLTLINLFALVTSLITLIHSYRNNGSARYEPWTLLALAITAIITAWYTRSFATTVQDRIIRAEENLRHFTLTGKLLDNRLSMDQIIALRFAPDDEFLPLIQQAISERLNNKNIKLRIKHWKADSARV